MATRQTLKWYEEAGTISRYRHIGLPLIANTNLDVLVKLSPINSTELRLLDLKALLHAFYNDPDLASLPRRVDYPNGIHQHRL